MLFHPPLQRFGNAGVNRGSSSSSSSSGSADVVVGHEAYFGVEVDEGAGEEGLDLAAAAMAALRDDGNDISNNDNSHSNSNGSQTNKRASASAHASSLMSAGGGGGGDGGGDDGAGPSQQSLELAGRCVGSLWLCGTVGAYCSWLGLLKPLLDSRDTVESPALASVGVLALVCYASSVGLLWAKCDQHPQQLLLPSYPPASLTSPPHPPASAPVQTTTAEEAGEEEPFSPEALVAAAAATPPPSSPPPPEIFHAPGVPFTPGAAIFFNFMLMAQYDALTHAYLFGLIAVALSGYTAYKSSSSGGRNPQPPRHMPVVH
jgi:hypothetical protein